MTSLDNLVNNSKLPVLFIGSGFSKRYIDAPDWENLLMKTYEFMNKTHTDFKTLKLRLKNKAENKDLEDGELNAIIAEKIEDQFNEYFYESELPVKYPEWIELELNPFRKCVASLLDELRIVEDKTDEIEKFKGLKNKVMSVITTNYDNLIESLFDSTQDNIFIGQPQLFSPNSIELGEIFKIHGCVSKSDDIVITKADYDNFRENAKLFSAKLLTLISENPVVFIGYSINDPNIQQTLSDLVRCLSQEQINNLKNHFYVIEYNQNEESLVEKEYLFRAKSYNGEVTTFPLSIISTDNYAEVYNKLSQLTPAMNLNTVKQVKRIVKDIVIDSTESKPSKENVMTILLDDISKLKQSDQKFAIAIGNPRDITNHFGYNVRPIEDILEDILFDNKQFNHKRLITETFENAYFKVSRILPIYKYILAFSEQEIEQLPKVKKYLSQRNKKKDFLNKAIENNIENFPTANSIQEMDTDYKSTTYRKYLWIIKNFENIPLSEIRQFLQDEFNCYTDFDSNGQSNYRRLVALYDYYKYYHQ